MSEHVLGNLSAYLDGELGASEQERFQAHLRVCPDCARRLGELAAVDGALRDLPEAAPLGYFEALPARIRSRLAVKAPMARGPWRVPSWALALAAGLVVAALAPVVLLQRPQVSAPTPQLQEERQPAPQSEPRRSLERPQSTTIPLATSVPPAPRREALAARVGREDDARENKEKLRLAPPATGPGAPAPTSPAGARDSFAAAQPGRLELSKQESTLAAPPAAVPVPAQKAVLADREARERDADTARARNEPSASAPQELEASEVGVVSGRAASARVAGGSLRRYTSLLERSPRDAQEARTLRESWRRLLADVDTPAEADTARVRVIEMGAAAWRFERQPEDRTLLKHDAAAYLARPDARQGRQVRALIDALAR